MKDQYVRPASLGAQVLLLTEQFSSFKNEFAAFRNEVQEWTKTKRNQTLPFLAILLGVLAPFWFVLNLQINAATAPLRESVQHLDGISVQNAERTLLNQRVLSSTREHLSSLQSSITKALAEVETQVDSVEQTRNQQFANIQRKLNDHQNALHGLGATIPMAPNGPYFFPNISGRKALQNLEKKDLDE